MTKGALKQRWFPHDPEWHDSDLFRALATDFGLGGPTVWMVLKSEWIEPEAEIIERTVNGQPTRGLYRKCRFSYLWDKFPVGSGLGSKTLAEIMVWLHNREQWTLDQDSVDLMSQLCQPNVTSMRRGATSGRHLVGAFSSKWLEFREACFAYRRGEESRGSEPGSTEPNQDQIQPSFKYVLNSETGEYDRVSAAEKELRGDLDE